MWGHAVGIERERCPLWVRAQLQVKLWWGLPACQLAVARLILKCALLWPLGSFSIFPRGVTNGCSPKCLWTQLDRPTTSESNETCDVCWAIRKFQQTRAERRGLWWVLPFLLEIFENIRVLLLKYSFISGSLGSLVVYESSFSPRHGINPKYYQIIGCEWTVKISAGRKSLPSGGDPDRILRGQMEWAPRIRLGPRWGRWQI